jgi:hypothetical protein
LRNNEQERLENVDRSKLHSFSVLRKLLMGEFEGSGMGQKKGLVWALSDILTRSNFEIAIIGAGIGYPLVEFLRTRY